MSKTTNILLLIFGTCLFLFAGIYGQVLTSDADGECEVAVERTSIETRDFPKLTGLTE